MKKLLLNIFADSKMIKHKISFSVVFVILLFSVNIKAQHFESVTITGVVSGQGTQDAVFTATSPTIPSLARVRVRKVSGTGTVSIFRPDGTGTWPGQNDNFVYRHLSGFTSGIPNNVTRMEVSFLTASNTPIPANDFRLVIDDIDGANNEGIYTDCGSAVRYTALAIPSNLTLNTTPPNLGAVGTANENSGPRSRVMFEYNDVSTIYYTIYANNAFLKEFDLNYDDFPVDTPKYAVCTSDFDGDGISDSLDLDDDNDGITDKLECGGNDPNGDADGDGLPNYLDTLDNRIAANNFGGTVPAAYVAARDTSVTNYTDANGDGVPDVYAVSTDNDGNPNQLDLDSDGDGCYDALEGDENVTSSQLNANGSINTTANGGIGIVVGTNNGVPNLVNSGGAADVGADVGQGFNTSQNTSIKDSSCYNLTLNPDSGASATGISGTAFTVPNVLTNDTLDSVAPVIGTNPGQVTISQSGSWPAGISLNTANGTVGVAASVPAGTYNVTYQVCVNGASPALCKTTLVTIVVKLDTDGDGIANDVDLDDDNDGIVDTAECPSGSVTAQSPGFGITPNVLTTASSPLVVTTDINGALLTSPVTFSTPQNINGSTVATITAQDIPLIGSTLTFNSIASLSGSTGVLETMTLGSAQNIHFYAGGLFNSSMINTNDKFTFTAVGAPGGFAWTVQSSNNSNITNSGNTITIAGNSGLTNFAEFNIISNMPITTVQIKHEATGISAFAADNGLVYVDFSNGSSVGCDADGDGIPNSLDLDSDNDGLLDIWESLFYVSNIDPDGDGKIGTGNTPPDADGDGLADIMDPNTPTGAANTSNASYFGDRDGDGVKNQFDIDSDNDGIVDNIEGQATIGYVAPTGIDTDKDGIDNAYDVNSGGDGIGHVNTDGGSAPDYVDLDADNDGFWDLQENQLGASSTPTSTTGYASANPVALNANEIDADGNGLFDGPFTDTDGDGLLDAFDTVSGVSTPNNATNNQTPSGSMPNTQAGATPERDWRESLDSDADGVPDAIDVDDDNDGILDTVEGLTTDKDGDGLPDYLDLDSDNDGIYDVIEAGGTDPDNDGFPGTTPTTGPIYPPVAANGLPTALGGTALTPGDFDGDGIPNYLDLDSDNDGIYDVLEAGGTDANNDGMVGGAAFIDTDADGINDIVDRFNNISHAVMTGTPLPIPNTDASGGADYIDTDADGDGCFDAIEGTQNILLANIDVNGFITGGVNALGVPNILPNGQGVGFSKNLAAGCVDTDNDGYPDGVDFDDDNDGILDTTECNIPLNTAEFSGTFGSITNTNRNLQSPVSNYFYGGTGANSLIGEGYYVVTSFSNSNTVHPNNDLWKFMNGHTTGTADDAYLAVNGSTSVGVFYSQNITVLPNSDYEISLWAINAITSLTYIGTPANIGIRVKNSLGTVIANTSTGNLYPTLKAVGSTVIPSDWHPTSLTFNTASATSLTLEVYNISTSSSNNDFAIDDICIRSITCNDTDGDGIPNGLDTDSDGDGCPDAIEGAGNITASQVSSGQITGGVDATGIPTAVGAGQGIGLSQDFTKNDCIDTDADGVPDVTDLDNDNDGILDTVECAIACSDPFLNRSFELQETSLGVSTPFTFIGAGYWINQSTINSFPRMYGWQTSSSDNQIEVWSSGGNGVPSADGNYFVELNANQVGTLYQTFCLNGSSGTVSWSVKHRGRSGTDVAAVKFGANLAAAQAAAATQTMTDGGSAWGTYSGTYTIPAGQTTLVIAFQSISSATGPASGNLLDDVQISITQGCPDIDGDSIPNNLDTDSDNDGCPDAVEGGGAITSSQLTSGHITGSVDANGVPVTASGGQTLANAANAALKDPACYSLTLDTNSSAGSFGTAFNIATVLTNDTLDGAAPVIGSNPGQISISQTGVWPAGITLNADGTVSVGAAVPIGTYNVTYQVCVNGTSPALCQTSTVTIDIALGCNAGADAPVLHKN